MKWERKALNELGYISRGKSKHRPRNDPQLYGDLYPFIQTADVKHADLYINDVKQYYSEAGLAQSKLWLKGTLCITIAANIADTAILGIDACFPDSIIGFIADEDKCDVKFIKYQFNLMQKHFQLFSQGSTQDNLSQEKLLSLKFLVPPLPIQKKIASILSAYDDLIENNLRRIELLEQAARELYKEWFVRFKFPGHEKAKFKDGLPEGWERKKLGEVALYINRGITPKYNEVGEYIVLNQKCIRNNSVNFELARRQDKKYDNEKQIQIGDVLINSTGTGTLGRIAQVVNQSLKTTVDSHITILRPDTYISKYWFGYLMSFLEPTITLMGEGATNQIELKRQRVADIDFFYPNKKSTEIFDKIVLKNHLQKKNLILQNQLLKQARDLLLPRLMKGEIEV